ncbi:MAG: type II secretion system protein [Phycisphaerae bacterium]
MRTRAFTLIELLVVVAVIALLISILLPALHRARDQAKAGVCLANLRSLGTALQTYLHVNRDRFPMVGFQHGGQSDPASSWITLLMRDYGARGGETRTGTSGAAELLREIDDVRRCPADRSPHFSTPRLVGGQPHWRVSSFGTNYYFAVPREQIATIGKTEPFDRLDRVPRAATTIYFGELAETGEYATADHAHPEFWFGGDPRTLAGRELTLERHNRRGHYGFIDGHAAAHTFEDTYQIDVAGTDLPSGRIAWFRNRWDPDVAK